MSRARGRSEIAKKERTYLRRHPGTLNGTLKYMAEQRSLKKRAEKKAQQKKEPERKELDWIDQVVEELHEDDLRAKEMAPAGGNPDEA